MKEIKKLSIFIFGIFLICYFFYLLDTNQILEIKKQGFKSFIFMGIIPFSLFSILFIFLLIKSNILKLVAIILPTIALIQVYNFGILNTIFFSSSWKTQTIIYQNKFDDSKKVEFQMYDIGFAGYHERTVEVNYITNWFFISKEVGVYNSDWVKVDKEINEMNLKH